MRAKHTRLAGEPLNHSGKVSRVRQPRDTSRKRSGVTKKESSATPTGFEPVRAKHTRLAGEPLNHSGKVSSVDAGGAEQMRIQNGARSKKEFPVRESNPGLAGESRLS